MFCEDYPVHNYTLEVNSSLSEVVKHSLLPQSFKLIGNLSENRKYSFRVVAANAIGSISSSDGQFCELSNNYDYNFHVDLYYTTESCIYSNLVLYHIDTTDLQLVTAIIDDETSGMITVQYKFIPGSDAQGCMVILVGESDNITVNLTRHSTIAIEFINVTCPLINNYIRVIGYDIESDNKSIRPLAVHGRLLFNNSILCPLINHEMESSLSELLCLQ